MRHNLAPDSKKLVIVHEQPETRQLAVSLQTLGVEVTWDRPMEIAQTRLGERLAADYALALE